MVRKKGTRDTKYKCTVREGGAEEVKSGSEW